MNFYTPSKASDKLAIKMSEAAIEPFGQRGKSFSTEDQDVEGESNKLTNSDFEPVSSEFTESSAEKTSNLQLANTTSKGTSPPNALYSNDGSKPPTSFKRWCVECYPKFYTYAYYCLILSIVVCIFTFMRISWSIFLGFMTVVGYLLSVGTRPTDISSESFSQKRENLQQPMRTVPRPGPIDSISSISGKSGTLSRNVPAIQQTLGQHQLSASQQAELRLRALGTGRKDSISLISGKSSIYSQNGRAVQQTVANRAERLRALAAGRKDPVPMVCVRRTTSIVEKSVSVGIRPAESIRTGTVSTVHSRFTKIVEDFLPSALFSRRNVQKPNEGKGKQSTSKHEFTTREKALSRNQFLSENSRRHPQAGNVASRANNMRKDANDQSRPKHGSKTGEKASSGKQRQNTASRREERHHGSNKVETRTHNKTKGIFGQAAQKHGPKKEEKTSSNKKHQNIVSKREERGSRTSNADYARRY